MNGTIIIELEEGYLDFIQEIVGAKTTNEVRAFLIGAIEQNPTINENRIKRISVTVKKTGKSKTKVNK